LLGINRDVTEIKRAEQALLEINADLERRVNARTTDVKGAVARLEEHDRARAEFVSNVSHETGGRRSRSIMYATDQSPARQYGAYAGERPALYSRAGRRIATAVEYGEMPSSICGR